MKSKNILLVDDDPFGVELALAALADSALADHVAVVRDGVEALEYLNRAGAYCGRAEGDPVVILLDVKMPRMNGLEVLARVRGSQQFRTLPVVMLSSSREESDKTRSYDLGANAYVVKPVDYDEFKAIVRRIGRFWVEINEPPPARCRQN